MQLKIYLGNLFLDKCDVYFDESIATIKDRNRHIETLAAKLYQDNKKEIEASQEQPQIFMHFNSVMNKGFTALSWEEIIHDCGSEAAKKNISGLITSLRSEERYQNKT